jgi:hypothetical protein
VVSQSGDGGSVIGLPAWLNALRQRAFLIKEKEARVLHFINVTDTQVYSNTGGESSASSMLGMSTLTTPLGKFLVGNQRIQWQLINLAAEFPGILVGMGHSANKLAMQEFWAEADRLGRSAIRWDVTPCPETGKFFGEDPDLLARVMAHAGMLPEVVFVGRLRKRVAPLNLAGMEIRAPAHLLLAGARSPLPASHPKRPDHRRLGAREPGGAFYHRSTGALPGSPEPPD